MTRGTPPSDWVAYTVVIGVVVAMLYGKYLMAKGDTHIMNVIEEDLSDIENTIEKSVFKDTNK